MREKLKGSATAAATLLAYVAIVYAIGKCSYGALPPPAQAPSVESRVNLSRVCSPDRPLRECVDLLVKLGVRQVDIGGGFQDKADAPGK